MKSIFVTDSLHDRLQAWVADTGHGVSSVLEAALNALDKALVEKINKDKEIESKRIDLRGEDPT